MKIRPVNANYLRDIFRIQEGRARKFEPRDIEKRKLIRLKKVLDENSKKCSFDAYPIQLFEDVSPFTAHALKNKGLTLICKKLLGVNLGDTTSNYFFKYLKDKKVLLYINMNPMTNIEAGITVMDEMGNTLRVDDCGQIECEYCDFIKIDKKNIELRFKFYFGFIKESDKNGND